MVSYPRSQTSGSFPARARMMESPASTRGYVGGSDGATEESNRGECGEDVWVSSIGVAPFSWWFSVGLVLASASSVVLSSLVWVDSTVGRNMASVSPSVTSYIFFSLLVCPTRSGNMADLLGKFTVESTYSEMPSLPPKLSANLTPLSGSESNLGDATLPSIGRARFEFILVLLTAAGVTVSEAEISVSAWSAWAVLALAGKSGHSSPSMRNFCDNSGKYG